MENEKRFEQELLEIYRKYSNGTTTLQDAKGQVSTLYKKYNIIKKEGSQEEHALFILIKEEYYRNPYPVIFGDAEEAQFLKEWNREECFFNPDKSRRLSGRIFWQYFTNLGGECKLLTTKGGRGHADNKEEDILRLLAEQEELKQERRETSPLQDKLNLLEEASIRRGKGKEEKQKQELLKLLRECYSCAMEGDTLKKKFLLVRLTEDNGAEYKALPAQLREASAPERYIKAIEKILEEHSSAYWGELPASITKRWILDLREGRIKEQRRNASQRVWEDAKKL